tara:strand:+ start:1836 stop:2066 length:231 start_codon:yes stop_codon:yes gene_type:complete
MSVDVSLHKVTDVRWDEPYPLEHDLQGAGNTYVSKIIITHRDWQDHEEEFVMTLFGTEEGLTLQIIPTTPEGTEAL